MIDTSRQLKKKGAKRVFICTTFGLFTNGIEVFDEGFEKGDFDALITTNLTYQNPEFVKRPYYHVADMSKFMATIIDFMNHDDSLSNVITPTDKLHRILEKYNSRTAKTEDLFD